jgi:hypothetical protein
MRTLLSVALLFPSVALLLLPALPAQAGEPQPKPFLWACFAGAGDKPFAADVDQDGYADLLAFAGGGIWVAKNEVGQKCHGGDMPVQGFYDNVEACAFGDLDGDRRCDAVTLTREGKIKVATSDGKLGFVVKERGSAPVAGDVRLVCADADGDGIDDLYVFTGGVNEAGDLLLIRNSGRGSFEAPKVVGQATRDAWLADVDGDGRADLVTAREGNIYVRLGRGAEGFGEETLFAKGVGGPILAVGDADGDGRADLVVPGAWIYSRKEGPKVVRDRRLAAPRGAACCLADIDGDGLKDFVCFNRSGSNDVIVALSRPPGWGQVWTREMALVAAAAPGTRGLLKTLGRLFADTDGDGLSDFEEIFVYHTDPLDRDTDGDGLLDGWEVKGFRGVRLQDMGADPRHKDIFLELDVEQTADMPRVQRAIDRMHEIYSKAPVKNPDGRPGIDVHCFVDTRVPLWEKDGPSRQQMREFFFTPSRVGIFHWMHLAARGGGGQADCWSDQGSCAGAFECTLPHEFGHQLGLNHGGGDGMNGIPIYPSLMNYAYNYVLPQYSTGALAGIDLDEDKLPERLAVPFEKLKYLAGPPFHFKVEPRDDGKSTWVDWNRNGREDKDPVRENINAAAGEGYGPREILDKLAPLPGGKSTRTTEQPALVTVPALGGWPETLVLLYVPREGGGLALRTLAEEDWAKWGPEARVAEAPADLHEISATVDVFGLLHVLGTSAGKVVEVIGSERGEGGWAKWTCEAREGAGVPAVVADGADLCLVLRHEDGGLVAQRLSRAPLPAGAAAPALAEVAIEGVKSSVPAALAIDTVKHELLMATSDPGGDRMRLTRLDPATFRVISTEPVGGEKGGDATNQRAAIVFETAPWLEPEGRVDIFVAGKYDLAGKDPNNCTHMYRCYTIGDKAWLGRAGWKCDMTWNEWTYTLSGVAAAWFHGRPWHASRYFTIPVWDPQGWKDSLCIASHADGVCDVMHDFNDWELIERQGLVRSILHASTPRGRPND